MKLVGTENLPTLSYLRCLNLFNLDRWSATYRRYATHWPIVVENKVIDRPSSDGALARHVWKNSAAVGFVSPQNRPAPCRQNADQSQASQLTTKIVNRWPSNFCRLSPRTMWIIGLLWWGLILLSTDLRSWLGSFAKRISGAKNETNLSLQNYSWNQKRRSKRAP